MKFLNSAHDQSFSFLLFVQVIEKDLNAALDQQRAASLARSSHKTKNGSSSGNGVKSSEDSEGYGQGEGSEDYGQGEGEGEEVDSKVAALVEELAASRRAHEDTESRLQREVKALRPQVRHAWIIG